MKQKPRKKSSSAIGATTQTRSATATSAGVEPSAPSSVGRSSFSLMPSAAAQSDEKAKKPTQATPASRRGQSRCAAPQAELAAAAGGSSRRAIRQGDADQREVLHVGAADRDAGRCRRSVSTPATSAMSAITPTPTSAASSVNSIAANGAQSGQRGSPSPPRRARPAAAATAAPAAPDALGQLGTRRRRAGPEEGGGLDIAR